MHWKQPITCLRKGIAPGVDSFAAQAAMAGIWLTTLVFGLWGSAIRYLQAGRDMLDGYVDGALLTALLDKPLLFPLGKAFLWGFLWMLALAALQGGLIWIIGGRRPIRRFLGRYRVAGWYGCAAWCIAAILTVFYWPIGLLAGGAAFTVFALCTLLSGLEEDASLWRCGAVAMLLAGLELLFGLLFFIMLAALFLQANASGKTALEWLVQTIWPLIENL